MKHFARTFEKNGYQLLVIRASHGGLKCPCSTPGCRNTVPELHYLTATTITDDDTPLHVMLCLDHWTRATTEQLLESLTEADVAELLRMMQDGWLGLATQEECRQRYASFSLYLDSRVAA